jgi:hypothetical protein
MDGSIIASLYSVMYELMCAIIAFVVIVLIVFTSMLPLIWKDRPECLDPNATDDFHGFDIVNKARSSRTAKRCTKCLRKVSKLEIEQNIVCTECLKKCHT